MYTLVSSTAGASTMKPPGMGVCQISTPVSACTAQTTPVQSPKYATPATTAGVPETPVRSSFSQLFVSFATLAAVIVVSDTFVRVFDRSCPYAAHSAPDESALEPF